MSAAPGLPTERRRGRRPKSSDEYTDLVANLNDRWRVIGCRDGVQWILQYRNRRHGAETVAKDVWRGRSYCRTKEALIRVCDTHTGGINKEARDILAGLPEWLPEKQTAAWPTSESAPSPSADTS